MIAKPDILIVGAGPVGLTSALIAHELGLVVRIIERRPSTQRAPAAHVINARTFEIWRQIGVDVDELRKHAQSPDQAGKVHWVTRLGERVLGSLQYEQQGDDNLQFTPTPLRNLAQHHLEPILVDELAKRNIHVEYSTTWLSQTQDEYSVTSTITSGDNQSIVQSTWLLACDGSSSAVRQSTEISMDGPDNLQKFAMFHFRADLSTLVGQHHGILYWICDPLSGGALVSHGGDNEWVYMQPVTETPTEPYSDEECKQIINKALAPNDIPLTMLRQSAWTMTSQLASDYLSGRVILAGDAAHRFPPTGGMGLNTGVADAHNVLWKIDRIKRGLDKTSSLNTYTQERRPIAERNAQASLDNAFKMFEVFMALGVDADPNISAANMEKALQSSESLSALNDAINNQATHFDMFGLQIGYRYVTPHSTMPIPPLTDGVIRNYAPSHEPGARLPHGWLQCDGHTISSLDLVPLGDYVVIAGPEFASAEPCIRVGHEFSDPTNWFGETLGLAAHQAVLVRPDQHIEKIL
jgi:2-polyprenyl-6-methoxyphenol hydroxylase-like FAD-dependent oxidoreductase